MRLQKINQLLTLLQELLAHLELLIREKKPLSVAEINLLGQLPSLLPTNIALVRDQILPRINWLLRSAGSKKSEGVETIE